MDFENAVNGLKSEVEELAKSMLNDYKVQAISDGHAFIDSMKDDIKKWASMLANEKMSRDEFDSLMRGQKDLGEMKALKQAGLAKVQYDKFVNAIIDKTIDKFLG